MKSTIIILITLITGTYAGFKYGYNANDIETDNKVNRIYIGINSSRTVGTFTKSEKMGYEIVDYLIYNPKSKMKTRLIPDNKKPITYLLFEVAYSDTLQSVRFNTTPITGSIHRDHHIINNCSIEKRTEKNKLLFVLDDRENSSEEFWYCTKDGKELKKFFSISTEENYDWHIDVLNGVIRFIIKKPNSVELKEFIW